MVACTSSTTAIENVLGLRLVEKERLFGLIREGHCEEWMRHVLSYGLAPLNLDSRVAFSPHHCGINVSLLRLRRGKNTTTEIPVIC